MISIRILVCSALISYAFCSEDLVFPPSFKFGAGSSAYQIEGAWNVSDKGESIWDRIVHTRPELTNYDTGDVACDSYHLWRRDIEIIEELGLNMYRFSISWPRLLPNGFANYISEDGKKYYSDLIDGLLEKGIEPVITLYHYDLPQSLQDLGGWVNPLVADWFADYARVVFSLYADRVQTWLTLNEPFGICDMAYEGLHAPFVVDKKVAPYVCTKNVIMAHAKAWRIYDGEFRPLYNGKVAWASVSHWFQPKTESDKELSDLTLEFMELKQNHPIYSEEGGWPPALEKYLEEWSEQQGFSTSVLPVLTAEEIHFIKGTHDFYALNHYSTAIVRKAFPGEELGVIFPLNGSEVLGVVLEMDPDWEEAEGIFSIYPEGLYKHLRWIKDTYNVDEIIITENGYHGNDNRLDDIKRTRYIRNYLEQVLFAIRDGVPVTGYTAWSLMDCFEWDGYGSIFGLYAVNFSDPMRTRTPRDSAKYYAKVTRQGTLLPVD